MESLREDRAEPTDREAGVSSVEIALTLLVIALTVVAATPAALGTIRTYRRDAAARHVMWKLREAQSLATSRSGVFAFQWGPDAGRTARVHRLIRDSTRTCTLPGPSAPADGTDVIEDWFDFGDAFPGLTIRSITDSSGSAVGTVMFTPIGASVNTCATVAYPVTVTIADAEGRTRRIGISAAGRTSLQ